MKRFLFLAGVLAAGLMLCSIENAAALQLSNASSNETPAEWLAADLEFSVKGSTLTLTITNQTGLLFTSELVPERISYNISEIYFNVSPNVTGLTLNPVTGWTLYTLLESKKNSTKAGGFGTFDYAIKASNKDFFVLPGDSQDFSFNVPAGVSPLWPDFGSEWTYGLDGNPIALVAAKFVMGPKWNTEDDSAYGALASVPEPRNMLLLGCGMIGLAMFGRKRFLRG